VSKFETKPNTGVLFKNNDRETPEDRVMAGNLLVTEPGEYWVERLRRHQQSRHAVMASGSEAEAGKSRLIRARGRPPARVSTTKFHGRRRCGGDRTEARRWLVQERSDHPQHRRQQLGRRHPATVEELQRVTREALENGAVRIRRPPQEKE
jgi:hypothetical protein